MDQSTSEPTAAAAATPAAAAAPTPAPTPAPAPAPAAPPPTPPPLPPRVGAAAMRPPEPPLAPRRPKRRLGCLVAVLVVVILAGLFGTLVVMGVLADSSSSLMSGVYGGKDPERRVVEQVIRGEELDTENKVVVIDVKGIIVSEGAYESAGSRRIAYELETARQDPAVRAIVLDMNTPGGEVTASDEIHREVHLCSRDGIPVVTCMRSVAASGGYFVAAASDWVVANRLTITGSIGVIIGTTNYTDLFTKIGLEAEVYKSGPMKDMLRGSRERTDMERVYVQRLVDETYREFATVVANGRTRYDTAEDVISSEFGDGRILSGAEALKLGLVDQIGYFDDAIDKARELAGEPMLKVVRYRRPMRFTDLLMGMQAQRSAGLRSLLPAEMAAVQPGRLYFLMPSALP